MQEDLREIAAFATSNSIPLGSQYRHKFDFWWMPSFAISRWKPRLKSMYGTSAQASIAKQF